MANVVREQSEIERDDASHFAGMHYMSVGFFPHFHRNLEIYGVVKGSVDRGRFYVRPGHRTVPCPTSRYYGINRMDLL